MSRALLQAWRRMGQCTLRITVQEDDKEMTIKLEGRVTGPWAAELGRLWDKTAPVLKSRKLSLDLRDVTYADAAGIKVLRTIYSEVGAAVLTGTPWTQYLAEELTRNDAGSDGEV